MKMSETQKVQNIKELPIRPCGHYVLVKPDRFERTTKSGIVIATEQQGKREDVASVKGTLVAAGPIAWKDYEGGQPWANVGDRVYYKRHIADRIQDDDDLVDGKPQEYFLMNDLNILGVINER